jgi:hypothetical protein
MLRPVKVKYARLVQITVPTRATPLRPDDTVLELVQHDLTSHLVNEPARAVLLVPFLGDSLPVL